MKEIKDIKTDIITNILKIDDTKNLDVTNLNIDEFIKNLNLNTSDISKIHTKLNEIVNLCNKQIEEVQNSPNIIKVNNKEINVSHLKDKIIK
jgi:D-serine dehydratase